MPLYLINARDKANARELRMESRPAHLDYLRAAGASLRMAGPVLGEDGETVIGSGIVIEAETLEDAERWATQDPYAKAGLFQSVEILPFKWVLGDGKPDA